MRAAVVAIALAALQAWSAAARRDDLGCGFTDHGVAAPIAMQRGIVVADDAKQRPVILVWLYDHRGGYALLLVDADTGRAEQYALPFSSGGDGPFASILSRQQKFYTHFSGQLVEFDPVRRDLTHVGAAAAGTAMSFTEDDRGVIWGATHPKGILFSWDPSTRTVTEHGAVAAEDWQMYPRSVAVDDVGVVYVGVGVTAGQIVAYDPKAGTFTPLVPEAARVHGAAVVVRDDNGRVYGHRGDETGWVELYGGVATPLSARPTIHPTPIRAGDQTHFQGRFNDGRVLKGFDTVTSTFQVLDPATGAVVARSFSHASEGPRLMGVIAAPDGAIVGGTSFPMRAVRYEPTTDTWTHRESRGQWNVLARAGEHLLVGAYTGGALLDWVPAAPWVPSRPGDPTSNPRLLAQGDTALHRPHDLLALPDGRTVIMAGTPGYGLTGGALLFFDRTTSTTTIVPHTALLPGHATHALAALPDGTVVGGTTTAAGTGGARTADVALLYLLDPQQRAVTWSAPVIPGARGYTDLVVTANGIVYGIADQRYLFAWDAQARQLLSRTDTHPLPGPSISQQGPRVFIVDDGTIWALFGRGIARIDPATHAPTLIATSPVPIHVGGDAADGRLWFGSGSHLYSFRPAAACPPSPAAPITLPPPSPTRPPPVRPQGGGSRRHLRAPSSTPQLKTTASATSG